MLLFGPIRLIDKAEVLLSKLAGITSTPEGILIITRLTIIFVAILLKAVWICVKVVPTGQVTELLLLPWSKVLVQGAITAGSMTSWSNGKMLTPSTKISTRFPKFCGRFLGGLIGLGLLVHEDIFTVVKMLKFFMKL